MKRFCRHGVDYGLYCQSCPDDIAGGIANLISRIETEAGGEPLSPELRTEVDRFVANSDLEDCSCGCTIHVDRGEPCQNEARICFRCERECWGYGLSLREGVEEILRNSATYHDAGAITYRLRRLLDYEDAE